MEIFILELPKAAATTEQELITTVLSDCYQRKANGEAFRGKAYNAYTSDGDRYKVTLKFNGVNCSGIAIFKTPMIIPMHVFPFMLTAPDFKKFFRCREDMIKFLMEYGDGVEYELTTTSETMLNNKGVLTPFNIKYTAADNTLIVDGKKYQLNNE